MSTHKIADADNIIMVMLCKSTASQKTRIAEIQKFQKGYCYLMLCVVFSANDSSMFGTHSQVPFKKIILSKTP